jgi:hypothetical protein
MAKYGPASAWLIIGGKDVTGDHFVLTGGEEQTVEQTNALGDSWQESLPVGVAKYVLEANGGLYDDRTAGMLDVLQIEGLTPASSPQSVAFGFAGNAPGKAATMLYGTYIGTFVRIAAKDGLTKAHATHVITGSRLEGVLLHGTATAETTASGDTTAALSVDNLASSSGGITADLQVAAITLGGYTNVAIKVRHSADDVTYTDLVTFTPVTLAGSQRMTVAGTVNRHLAVSWAFSGAGSGQSITFAVAVNRG